MELKWRVNGSDADSRKTSTAAMYELYHGTNTTVTYRKLITCQRLRKTSSFFGPSYLPGESTPTMSEYGLEHTQAEPDTAGPRGQVFHRGNGRNSNL